MKATLLVLAIIAAITALSIIFCASTNASITRDTTEYDTIVNHQYIYPDSISVNYGIFALTTSDSAIVKTTTEYSTIKNNQHQHWVNYPDSIMLRLGDFKYYWKDDIRNEYNHEWIVETAFNNDVTYENVTQAMFNKRYEIHTIKYYLEYSIKHKHATTRNKKLR